MGVLEERGERSGDFVEFTLKLMGKTDLMGEIGLLETGGERVLNGLPLSTFFSLPSLLAVTLAVSVGVFCDESGSGEVWEKKD